MKACLLSLLLLFGLTSAPPQGITEVEIAEPFTVRTVRGKILDQAKEPIPGADFRLRYGIDLFFTALSDKDGNFEISPRVIADGSKCSFRLTRSGFDPVVGTVIVSKNADDKSQIEITLERSN